MKEDMKKKQREEGGEGRVLDTVGLASQRSDTRYEQKLRDG